MASSDITMIATIFPKPGKIDRLVELLEGMGKSVLSNEPGTLKYQIHREIDKKTGEDELVMIEGYTDMEAVKLHGSTNEFKAFYKTVQEEDLIAAPTRVQILKSVGGFTSRL